MLSCVCSSCDRGLKHGSLLLVTLSIYIARWYSETRQLAVKQHSRIQGKGPLAHIRAPNTALTLLEDLLRP